jgi:hypothetical protein
MMTEGREVIVGSSVTAPETDIGIGTVTERDAATGMGIGRTAALEDIADIENEIGTEKIAKRIEDENVTKTKN